MPLLLSAPSWDGDFLIYIQEHIRCGFLDYIFPNITFLGTAGAFWIVLTAILLFFRKTRRAGVCSAFALIGSLLLNNCLLKPLVGRVRPYEVVEGLRLIGAKASDSSFPSGHAAASVASAAAMCRFLKKRFSIPLVVLALMIAFSRLYIGIHFPTDVLAGVLDGILLGILGCVIEAQMYRRWAWYAETCKEDTTAVESSDDKAVAK